MASPAQLGVPEPCPGHRRRSDRQFRLQLRRHPSRFRPHQPGDAGRRRTGKIVRQVYGEKFTAEDLAEPLKLLITGSAIPPEVGTLQEIMERVRILCSIYDPLTGRYRTNYSLYFQFAGFLTFVGFMIYLSINFWRIRRGETKAH
jgi:hypothetical protein